MRMARYPTEVFLSALTLAVFARQGQVRTSEVFVLLTAVGFDLGPDAVHRGLQRLADRGDADKFTLSVFPDGGHRGVDFWSLPARYFDDGYDSDV